MARRSREHPYRGDDAPDRLRRLQDEVGELAARIAESYWPHLGEELRTRAYGGVADEAVLSECRDELIDAIARAPQVAERLSALPHAASEALVGEPWPLEETVTMPAREWAFSRDTKLTSRIARWLDGYDPLATLLQHRNGDVRAVFRALEVPFVLHAEEAWWNDDIAITVATGVPRGAPRLDVAPRAWTHKSSQRFSGDQRFDALFVIDAPLGGARQLLGTEVRDGLKTIARIALPTFVVADGAAAVRWRYVLSTDLLDYAVHLLAAVRHTPLRLELVRAVERER